MKSPLVLVHGWAGSASAWRTVLPYLNPESWNPVVSFDLPGSPSYAGSAAPRIRDAALELVRRLRTLDSPAVLVGHSLGAQVTLLAQVMAPEAVKAEVVLDPAYDADDREICELTNWADRIASNGHEELVPFFVDALDGVDSHTRKRLMDDFRRTSIDTIVSYLRSEYLDHGAIGLHSATVEAARMRTRPVLALHSSSPAAVRARLLPAPSGSKVVEWREHRHFLHLQDPQRFGDEITSWEPARPTHLTPLVGY